MVASRSAWIPVSIFIASMVSKRSPSLTCAPAATATEATTVFVDHEIVSCWCPHPKKRLPIVEDLWFLDWKCDIALSYTRNNKRKAGTMRRNDEVGRVAIKAALLVFDLLEESRFLKTTESNSKAWIRRLRHRCIAKLQTPIISTYQPQRKVKFSSILQSLSGDGDVVDNGFSGKKGNGIRTCSQGRVPPLSSESIAMHERFSIGSPKA